MTEIFKIVTSGASPERRINAVIEEFGPWTVMKAAVSAAWGARRVEPPHIDGLNDHLRRDVGLEPSQHMLYYQFLRF